MPLMMSLEIVLKHMLSIIPLSHGLFKEHTQTKENSLADQESNILFGQFLVPSFLAGFFFVLYPCPLGFNKILCGA